MSLNAVTDANFGEFVKIIATIWSFPKHSSVVWRKGKMDININQQKYRGSSCDGNKPVLCIEELIKEDEDTYEIEVKNEKGTATCRSKLNVIGGKYIFVRIFSMKHLYDKRNMNCEIHGLKTP